MYLRLPLKLTAALPRFLDGLGFLKVRWTPCLNTLFSLSNPPVLVDKLLQQGDPISLSSLQGSLNSFPFIDKVVFYLSL